MEISNLNLKELRMQKGLSQVKAARFCDVSLNTWIHWEKHVTRSVSSKYDEKIRELQLLPDKK